MARRASGNEKQLSRALASSTLPAEGASAPFSSSVQAMHPCSTVPPLRSCGPLSCAGSGQTVRLLHSLWRTVTAALKHAMLELIYENARTLWNVTSIIRVDRHSGHSVSSSVTYAARGG